MIQNMSKPRRASSDISRGLLVEVDWSGLALFLESVRLLLFSKVHTSKLVLAAGVEKAVRKSRVSTYDKGQYLGSGDGLEAVRAGGRADQFPFLGQDQQLVASQGYGARLEAVLP